MPQTQAEPHAGSQPESGPVANPAAAGWREPEWLTRLHAEVARLSKLSPDERAREWDALPPAERAADEAAHDEVMRDIDARQRRSRGITAENRGHA